jgi:hypothetical protein
VCTILIAKSPILTSFGCGPTIASMAKPIICRITNSQPLLPWIRFIKPLLLPSFDFFKRLPSPWVSTWTHDNHPIPCTWLMTWTLQSHKLLNLTMMIPRIQGTQNHFPCTTHFTKCGFRTYNNFHMLVNSRINKWMQQPFIHWSSESWRWNSIQYKIVTRILGLNLSMPATSHI